MFVCSDGQSSGLREGGTLPAGETSGGAMVTLRRLVFKVSGCEDLKEGFNYRFVREVRRPRRYP